MALDSKGTAQSGTQSRQTNEGPSSTKDVASIETGIGIDSREQTALEPQLTKTSTPKLLDEELHTKHKQDTGDDGTENIEDDTEKTKSDSDPTSVKNLDVELGTKQPQPEGPEYSVFTTTQRKWIVFTGSFAALFSPMSAQIYFPALNSVASDLGVSVTKINLTVTTYLILQGLAPTMIAGVSDSAGRRPAYFICFTIYIIANIGLALQNSFPALLVLRMIQAAGSSSTVALSNGLVGDLVTSSERGKFVALSSVTGMLGPSISPIIGGLISQYAGWHWIFWFLLIFSVSFFIPLALFLPETCRKIVGNGSIPPPKINMSLTDYLRLRKRRKQGIELPPPQKSKLYVPNPLVTLAVLRDKETCILLMSIAWGMFCFYAISTAAAAQFRDEYKLTDVQISLMFLPIGFGSVISALTVGKVVDKNYARHAKRLGMPSQKNRAADLSNFPIEKARLEIAFPVSIASGIFVIVYGWVIDVRAHIAVPAVILFFLGATITANFQVLNVLLVDIWPAKAASVMAANNLVRCELGAVASAVVLPAIDGIGSGWTFTVFGLILLAWTGTLIPPFNHGIEWRRNSEEKREAAAKKKLEKISKKGADGSVSVNEEIEKKSKKKST